MAGNFLRKWFSKSTPDASLIEPARAELDRLAGERPTLAPLCRWLSELLPDLAGVVDPVGLEAPTQEQAGEKLAAGVPLLSGLALSIDGKNFVRLWQRGCDALSRVGVEGDVTSLREAVRQQRLAPQQMLEAVLGGSPGVVRDRAAELGLNPDLTVTLLRYTLFPTFTAWQRRLAPLAERAAWGRGHCPVCGAWPMLGEFRGLEQLRFLRCGLCAGSWGAERNWCIYCNNRDHKTLRFLHAEGEQNRYQAAVCDACRGYVKMVTTLSELPPLSLPVADLATLFLDLAAAERGYTSQP